MSETTAPATPAESTAPASPADTDRRGRLPAVGQVLQRSGVPLLLVLLIVFFSVDSKTGHLFRSHANLQNIFANQSEVGLIALGCLIPMVAGYMDLAVPAIAGISSVTVAALAGTHHQSVALSIVLGLLIGCAGGAVNGVLIAGVRLNPFITTLGTYTLFGGLLQLYTQGQTISNGIPASLGNLSSGTFLGIATPFWLLIVVALITWYVVTQTPFGRKLMAIGSNETAARLAGFRVDRAVFLTYLLSGFLGGVAGALITSQSLSADATTGSSYLFPALAAVFLGQTAIRPGQYNVWGTMFGVFLVAVAVNGFTLLGAAAWVTSVFNGGVLVLSIAFSTLMARRRDRLASAAALHVTTGASSAVQT